MKVGMWKEVSRFIPCQDETGYSYTVVERVTVTRHQFGKDFSDVRGIPEWDLSSGEGVTRIDEDTYEVVAASKILKRSGPDQVR